ncbi:MAG: hypothetical protein S4CHLAM123_01520 [Chlamydiales bacterium]|nr:hypothetical protein [Chlamydiales bacterium]
MSTAIYAASKSFNWNQMERSTLAKCAVADIVTGLACLVIATLTPHIAFLVMTCAILGGISWVSLSLSLMIINIKTARDPLARLL